VATGTAERLHPLSALMPAPEITTTGFVFPPRHLPIPRAAPAPPADRLSRLPREPLPV